MDRLPRFTVIGAASDLMLPSLVALVVIGVIVFACTVVAFRRIPMFGPTLRVVVAACIAALAVIGLFRTPQTLVDSDTPAPATGVSPEIEGALVVFGAMALAMLATLIMYFLIGLRRKLQSWGRSPLNSTVKKGAATGKNRQRTARDRIADRRIRKLNQLKKRMEHDDAD